MGPPGMYAGGPFAVFWRENGLKAGFSLQVERAVDIIIFV